MANRSISFKQIQKAKQIAEILNIDFESAQELGQTVGSFWSNPKKFLKDYTEFDGVENESFLAHIWLDVVRNMHQYPKQQVSEFESLITEGLNQIAGFCEVFFNKESGQIIVKLQNGLTAELISGEIIEGDAI